MAVLKTYLKGWLYWQQLRIKLKINYQKVVVVLTDDNRELDKEIMIHLKDFMDRKYADQAIILCKENRKIQFSPHEAEKWIDVHPIASERMELLYAFYSFMKFFDNIVFTYTEKPEDNLLGRYLVETSVNEEDAACLALYHLRCVPSRRAKRYV